PGRPPGHPGRRNGEAGRGRAGEGRLGPARRRGDPPGPRRPPRRAPDSRAQGGRRSRAPRAASPPPDSAATAMTDPVPARGVRSAARHAIVLLLLLLPLLLVSLLLGTEIATPMELVRALVDPTEPFAVLLRDWRLPRVLAAFLVGACLAMSGAI